MSNRLILLLLPSKLRYHDLLIYEILDLEKELGLQVEIHEMINFLYPDFSNVFENNTNHKGLKSFDTFKEWKKAFIYLIKKYGTNILVISNINNSNLNSLRVNYELKKSKAKIIEHSSLQHPEPSLNLNYKYLLKNIYRFIANLQKIRIFVTQKTLFFIARILGLFPTHAIKSGTEEFPKHYYKKKINIIEGNSFDYNMHLKSSKYNSNPFKGDFGLFLEAPSPLESGDRYLFGLSKSNMGTPEKWFPSLNKFFNIIENYLKLKILIAPHPKVKHVKNPKYYYGRDILDEKLFEVAKFSKVIISRESAGFSFAAIYNLPAIFIYTDEIKTTSNFMLRQKLFADELGSKPINIDEQINEDKLEELVKFNEGKYKEYINKYLTSRNDNKKNFQLITNLFSD